MSAAGAIERNTIELSDQSSDVTFSDTNGNSQFETFFDLTVPTGVEYRLVPARKMPTRDKGLFLRLDLNDTVPNDLPDSADVRIVVQSPLEDDVNVVGAKRTLRRFNQGDQFNENEVVRLDLSKEYRLAEDAHLKIQVNSGTAVSASDSWAQLEIVRLSSR